MNQGWECPKCGAVMSPLRESCINCKGEKRYAANVTTNNIDDVPSTFGSKVLINTYECTQCNSYIKNKFNIEPVHCSNCGSNKLRYKSSNWEQLS